MSAGQAPLSWRSGGSAARTSPAEVIHELPEDARHCNDEGTKLKEIGKEISEELHVVPARVEVTRHVRLKYGCPDCEKGVQIALAPPKLLPNSNASPTLLAYVTTAKY